MLWNTALKTSVVMGFLVVNLWGYPGRLFPQLSRPWSPGEDKSCPSLSTHTRAALDRHRNGRMPKYLSFSWAFVSDSSLDAVTFIPIVFLLSHLRRNPSVNHSEDCRCPRLARAPRVGHAVDHLSKTSRGEDLHGLALNVVLNARLLRSAVRVLPVHRHR